MYMYKACVDCGWKSDSLQLHPYFCDGLILEFHSNKYGPPTHSRVKNSKGILMKARITSTKTMICDATQLTADDILNFLESLSSDTKIRIKNDVSNRPGEISTVTFEAETSSQ